MRRCNRGKTNDSVVSPGDHGLTKRGADTSRRFILKAASLAPLLFAGAPAAESSFVELNLASDGDEMTFVPSHLSCPTGVRVRLRFSHRGHIIDDPHDWVLLKPGTVQAFLADADKQQDDCRVVPPGDEYVVLAHTPLCAKGHTVTVEFVAPSPGDYPFVCSVPGHGESMHGTLTVVT